jgi:hypothetical protein
MPSAVVALPGEVIVAHQLDRLDCVVLTEHPHDLALIEI